MAASPGPHGYPHQPPRPPRPRGRRPASPRRMVLLALTALACLLVIIIAVIPGPKPARAGHQAPAPDPHPTVARAVRRPVLECHARALRRRPRDHTAVPLRVRTAAGAWVTATSRRAAANDHASGRASARGTWRMRFRVGDARPGVRIVIAVRVSRHGHAATCRTSLRPRRIAVPAVRTRPRSSASVAPPPPSPTAASCYPISDEGTCYEPGEYCRDSDHGASGVAGNGERIVCEDNDGWRWEPV
jgi:hypothetical protein